MNKKALFAFATILFLATSISAADYYVAQTASGSENGSSCENADAIADLTWGSGNMVDAGDTLHICGTISTTLTVGASGTSGNEITIYFENGAKFSKPVWGKNASSAIYLYDKDYIIIDGGVNGVIENTNNGTGLTYHQDSYGIYLEKADHVEIENLTLQNLYVRSGDSADSDGSGTFILAKDCNSLTLHDLKITHAEYAFRSRAQTVDISGFDVYNCDISKVANGGVASLAGPHNYSDISIHDCEFYDFAPYWDGEWVNDEGATVWHHVDGLQFWGNYSSNTLGPLKIYNNYFHGDFGGHQTADVFTQDYCTPVTIYNNIFDNSAGPDHPSNGYVYLNARDESEVAKVYNNTFIGLAAGSAGGNGMNIIRYDADVKNNIFQTLNMAINLYSGNVVLTTDYNDYYNLGYIGKDNAGGTGYYSTLSSWQTFLGGCPGTDNDCNSITTDPGIGSNHKPSSESSSVVDAGTNLGSTFTTDKGGTTRPQGSAWDIGAYEYEQGMTSPVSAGGAVITAGGVLIGQ